MGDCRAQIFNATSDRYYQLLRHIRGMDHNVTVAFVLNDFFQWMTKWYSFYIMLAPLAVDTFLFISGMLLGYTFLKTMKKPKARFNLLTYYIHRYLRYLRFDYVISFQFWWAYLCSVPYTIFRIILQFTYFCFISF